jgi:hypothetical protein
MTPKEKAKELVHQYVINMPIPFHIEDAKICALIAVEEILNTLYSIPFGNALDNELEYWQEVKQEIEKK